MTSFSNSPVRLSHVALEARDMPSASVQIVGTRLEIQGDDAANRVEIHDDGRGNVAVKVTTGAEVVSLSGKNITRINVDAKGGDDVIDYRLTKSLILKQHLDIDTAGGNDNVRVDLYRGISGVPLDLDIDTGVGRDATEVRFGAISNANVDAAIALGNDADSLTFIMFNGASGKSRVALDVAGNNGADRVDINLMGKIDAAAIVDVRASNVLDANDRLTVRYRGELDGKLNLVIDKAAAGYGVQGHFTLDAASDGKLTAKVVDAKKTYVSSAFVTDATGGPKVTVLDRLVHRLTEPRGVRVTRTM